MLSPTLAPGLPRARDLRSLWHGLFAGSCLLALVTAEVSTPLHVAGGLSATVLLGLRLALARNAGNEGVWRLPWPRRPEIKAFARNLSSRGWEAFTRRTPLTPLGAFLMLVALAPVALSGLMALGLGWEDPHEALAGLFQALVFVHLGLVLLPKIWKRYRNGSV